MGMMAKLRYVWVAAKTKLGSGGRVTIGATGSMDAVPSIRAKGKGSIRIAPHCKLWDCRLTAVDGRIEVGEGTSIGHYCMVIAHEHIAIGRNVSIGPGCYIYDHDHNFGASGKAKGFKTSEVVIGDNVWLGAGVIVLRGAHIGANCVIGAGTVVKGNIPEGMLVTSERELKMVKLEDRG